jgi:hypothetical protein
MILSHPANTTTKWKILKLNKPELIEMWTELSNTPNCDNNEVLYSDYEIEKDEDEEEVQEDEVYNSIREVSDDEHFISTKTNKDVNNINKTNEDYEDNIIKDYEDSTEEEEDDTITRQELNAMIKKLQNKFKEYIQVTGADVDALIREVDEQVNDLLDRCAGLSKKQETAILNKFDKFLDKTLP